MDEIDCRIIECLKKNARMKMSEISGRVNLSVTSVADRIHRLEESGVITGYRVNLDMNKMGKDLSALISVSLEHPQYNKHFIDSVKLNDEVLECHYVTGDYDFIIKVVTSGSDGLEKLLNYIKGIKGVSLTRTLVILSTVKSETTVTPTL